MGFWGSLAGGLSSLIPGAGPLLAPLVGGAINSITGGGDTKTANQVNPALNDTLAQLKANGATGAAAVNTGMSGLESAKRNYQAGANGSLEQLQSLYNPEISTVLSQYDNAAKSAAEFGPRGGGRTAAMAELPFRKAGAVGQIIGGARAGATQGLADVSGKEAQLGTSLTGQSTGALSSLLAPKTQSDQLTNENSKALGTGIGGILGNIFQNKNKNKDGGFYSKGSNTIPLGGSDPQGGNGGADFGASMGISLGGS